MKYLTLAILILVLVSCAPIELPTPLPTATIRPRITVTPRPTMKPVQVTFVCNECVMDGDNIPITLWMGTTFVGNSTNRVFHGETCLLIDKAEVDGIKKVKLQCKNGTGWTRAEAVKYY